MLCTGYTSKLVHEGQSFHAFVLSCSRAFCGFMRDADAGAQVPRSIQPDCSYERQQLRQAKKQLSTLLKLTQAEKTRSCERWKADDVAERTKAEKEHALSSARVEQMKSRVQAWTPPADLQPLKEFMLEQLESSQGSDYYVTELRRAQEATHKGIYKARVSRCRSDIVYYNAEIKKAIKRAHETTKWLRALYTSLKPYEKQL